MNQSFSLDQIDLSRLNLSALTEQEQRELLFMLAEAKNRKLEIPVDRIDRTQVVFPRDENGYFVKSDGKSFKPYEAQRQFVESNARFVLFSGGRGSGKSGGGAQKALDKISQGQNGAIINPVFEDFINSTWQEFIQWVPPQMVVPKHRYRLRPDWQPSRPFIMAFTNGARVICKGLKYSRSGRGPNINWLWYDEGGSDEDGVGWRTSIAGVRVGNNPQAFVTTTPNGVLHWLYDFFISEERKELIDLILKDHGETVGNRPMTEHFHGTIEDNKDNLDPDFYASMKAAYSGKGWEEKQEIEGLFVQQGSALGDSNWFLGRKIESIPEGIIIKHRIRYWDLAASEKKIVFGKKKNDPDKTVGTLLSYATKKDNEFEKGNRLDQLPNYKGTDIFFIENQKSGYWKYKEILTSMWSAAQEDGYYVKIRVEQEPGSGGINQVAAIKLYFDTKCAEHNIPAFDIDGHAPEGDKVQRANIWFEEAAKGMFYAIIGLWNTMFFRILDTFPPSTTHGHDDEVDSVSGARIIAKPIKKWAKIAFRSLSG